MSNKFKVTFCEDCGRINIPSQTKEEFPLIRRRINWVFKTLFEKGILLNLDEAMEIIAFRFEYLDVLGKSSFRKKEIEEIIQRDGKRVLDLVGGDVDKLIEVLCVITFNY